MIVQETKGEATADFEFGADDNRLFRELGSKMLFVGMFFSVVGLLAIVLGVLPVVSGDTSPGTLALMFSGVMYVAIGVWTRSAGAEFGAIAATHGADRTHLFGALTNLKKLYTLMYWLAILASALFLLALVYSLMGRAPGQGVA